MTPNEQFYFPGRLRDPKIDDRKERFQRLNEFVQARHGWLTSVPGSTEVTMECLPGSTLPDDLRAAGHRVEFVGDGERILAAAIVQRFVINADGALQPLTEGSTRPVTPTVTHAGIAKVKRYSFEIP